MSAFVTQPDAMLVVGVLTFLLTLLWPYRHRQFNISVPQYCTTEDKSSIYDGYCDDVNNNVLCNFDGGDCCDNFYDVGCDYCEECICLGSGTVGQDSCQREIYTGYAKNCSFLDESVSDEFCDDANNNEQCNFDGGDCCNNPHVGGCNFCHECSCKEVGIYYGHYACPHA